MHSISFDYAYLQKPEECLNRIVVLFREEFMSKVEKHLRKMKGHFVPRQCALEQKHAT